MTGAPRSGTGLRLTTWGLRQERNGSASCTPRAARRHHRPGAVTLALLAVVLPTAAPAQQQGLEPLQQGKLEETEAHLTRKAAASPGHVPTLEALAHHYARARRFPEAIRAYERILALSPQDVGAKAHLAQLSSWTGDLDRAIVLYREAAAQAPGDLGLKSDLGDVLRWARRYEDAARLYQEVLARAPDHHEAIKGLAKVQLLTGDAAAAARLLDRALSLHPNDAELHKDRGRVFVHDGDLGRAAAALERATTLAPNDTESFRLLGEVFFRGHDYARAVDAYRRASTLEPGQTEINVMLARSYLSLGKAAQAREQVELALRHHPLDPAANELAAALKREARLGPARTAGELAELAAYALALAVVYAVARRMRRVLRRTPAYYYFALYVVPAFLLVNVVAHFVKPWLSPWVDPALFLAVTKAVLFLGGGIAFAVAVRAERRSLDLADQVVLAIGAHPDDIELGAGGFLLKLKASGARVYALTLTRGEKGTDAKGDREGEAARAARFLGLDGFWVLDLPDAGLGEQVSAVKAAIEEKIRELLPTLVLTHTEVDVHGDHRAVHAATREAARHVPTVLCYEDVSTAREFSPNYYVDITSYIDEHLKAVSFHRTQEHRTYMDPEVLKGRAAHRGMQVGVAYAQAFKALHLVR